MNGKSPILQLTDLDVCDELEYWSLRLVVYVLGLRPHVKAFLGF